MKRLSFKLQFDYTQFSWQSTPSGKFDMDVVNETAYFSYICSIWFPVYTILAMRKLMPK